MNSISTEIMNMDITEYCFDLLIMEEWIDGWMQVLTEIKLDRWTEDGWLNG